MKVQPMQRRTFLTAFCGATVPFAARAQQRPAMPVIGFLNSGSAAQFEYLARFFRQGLQSTGYVEGQNVAIEYRWADGQYDRLPALAAELVRRRVDVIAATASELPAQAAKSATTTIPIVFSIGGDPVAAGLVNSFNRPGGNLTGATTLGIELNPKRLELLHELMPKANITLLLNLSRFGSVPENLRSAARTLGLQLNVLGASTDRELDAVFENPAQLRGGALVIAADAFFTSRSEKLAALALRHAMPAIYQGREFAAAGGLMSYGGRFAETYSQAGVYAGRILKGEKPADLPVVQITRVELIINMKTAKTLGLSFPITLLGRADEVIE